jgi:hypothetical protein
MRGSEDQAWHVRACPYSSRWKFLQDLRQFELLAVHGTYLRSESVTALEAQDHHQTKSCQPYKGVPKASLCLSAAADTTVKV